MSEEQKGELEKVHKVYEVYPFINHLVDFLYTDELNDLISQSVHSDIDKRSFMMYIIMYFYVRMNIPNTTSKDEIKYFLTDIIKNPEKRQKCIELYKQYECNFVKNNSKQTDSMSMTNK